MRGGGGRRGRRRHSGIRIARIPGSETEGPGDEAPDRLDMLQLTQATQLPEEEHPQGEAAARNPVQHWFRTVVRSCDHGLTCNVSVRCFSIVYYLSKLLHCNLELFDCL